MPSAYLGAADYATYGVPNATAAQVIGASALVDTYLSRREGMQYMTDAAGLPAYMAGMTASMTINVAGGVPAGTNVVVPLTSGLSITGSLGEAVILDRNASTSCEACVISAITKTSFTLASVINSHAANTTVEFGLTVNEQISMPSKRSMVRIGSWPIVRLVSGLGSYRYGRRIDQQAGLYADQSILALMQTFGGPPEWLAFDVANADFNPMTGEVWIPSGIFLAYYSDVRLYYVAGFLQANIPPIIKLATAKIILAQLNTADLVGGVRRAQAGGSVIERFENTVMSMDERAQINLYRAKLYA